jgi:single-strand DNA-binding protein
MSILSNLNSILIEGTLEEDSKFITTPKGASLCTFTIATTRYFRRNGDPEKEVSRFNIETWSKLAQQCENMGHKGRSIRVVGRLKQNRWTDSEGRSQSKIVIVAEHIEFRPE